MPVGIGVHSGPAFVGVVGTSGGLTELAVLGDTPNVTSRLAGEAAAGEIVLSDETLSRLANPPPHELRTVTVKGKPQPMVVAVVGTSGR